MVILSLLGLRLLAILNINKVYFCLVPKFLILLLSAMAFESATKRNRVTVNIGDVGKTFFDLMFVLKNQ